MKRIFWSISIGILIGFVAGRLGLLLPPFWSVVFGFVLSLAVSFWALSSMRELDRRKRIIDQVLPKLQRSRKDLGPPLQ